MDRRCSLRAWPKRVRILPLEKPALEAFRNVAGLPKTHDLLDGPGHDQHDRHSANGMRSLGRPVTGLGKLAMRVPTGNQVHSSCPTQADGDRIDDSYWSNSGDIRLLVPLRTSGSDVYQSYAACARLNSAAIAVRRLFVSVSDIQSEADGGLRLATPLAPPSDVFRRPPIFPALSSPTLRG